MKLACKIVFAVLLLVGFSQASFFLDDPNENLKKQLRPLPTLQFGAAFSAAYYLNSFGFGGVLETEYRLQEHHSLELFVAGIFSTPFYELGLDWKYFFSGNLMQEKTDDFLLAGASVLYLDKYDGAHFPPRISLGYGRDFLFFDKADFICRVTIRLSYILGEAISEKNESQPVNKDTRFVAYVDFSLLFF